MVFHGFPMRNGHNGGLKEGFMNIYGAFGVIGHFNLFTIWVLSENTGHREQDDRLYGEDEILPSGNLT